MCVELINWVSPGRGWEKLADVSCPRTWNPKLREDLGFELGLLRLQSSSGGEERPLRSPAGGPVQLVLSSSSGMQGMFRENSYSTGLKSPWTPGA